MRSLQTILTVFILGILLGAPAVSGQNATLYPVVNDVRVEFDGVESVSEELVLSNVQLRAGMDYNAVIIDQSVRTLYDTGFFEFVEVKVEDVAENSVDVIFRVIPKYIIERITCSGNRKYANQRLLDEGGLQADVMLDEYKVSEAAAKIEAYYLKKGYTDIVVNYRIQSDDKTGRAVVLFDIDEGNKVRIKELSFEGNTVFKDARLAKVLETKKKDGFSWLTGAGRFDEAKFKEDLELLRVFYRNHGYLDVSIDEDAVSLDFKTERNLYITILIEEGAQYFLGQRTFEGATIFTAGELLSVVEMATGDPFSPEEVDEAATAVREYYTSRAVTSSSAHRQGESWLAGDVK